MIILRIKEEAGKIFTLLYNIQPLLKLAGGLGFFAYLSGSVLFMRESRLSGIWLRKRLDVPSGRKSVPLWPEQ